MLCSEAWDVKSGCQVGALLLSPGHRHAGICSADLPQGGHAAQCFVVASSVTKPRNGLDMMYGLLSVFGVLRQPPTPSQPARCGPPCRPTSCLVSQAEDG